MPPKNLFEYYKSKGQALPKVSDRAPVYEKAGLGSASSYTGSYDQNVSLLGSLTKSKDLSGIMNKNVPTPTPGPMSSATPIAPATPTEPPAVSVPDTTERDIVERNDDPTKVDFKDEKDVQNYRERTDPEGGAPERISGSEQFTDLMKEHGTEGIQDELNINVDEQDALMEGLRAYRPEAYKGQSLGFARGQISAEERSVQERLDFLQRRERTLRGRLDTKMKTIETIMGLTDKDYETARAEYEWEFNKNMAIETAMAKEEEVELTHDKAAYNTITGMANESGKLWDELTPATQQKIQELEVAIGIPIGTFEQFGQARPGEKPLMHSTGYDAGGNQVVSFVSQDAEGNYHVSTIKTGGVKTSAGGESKDEYAKAQQMVKDNPDASYAEIEAEIRKNTSKLSESDIDSLLGGIQFLSEEWFLATYSNVPEAGMLKALGKTRAEYDEAARKLGDLKSTEKKNATAAIKTEYETLLKSYMSRVEQYRKSGLSDREILKELT